MMVGHQLEMMETIKALKESDEMVKEMITELDGKKSEVHVLEAAIRIVSDHFNTFIGQCLDENGKPKAPSMGDLMKARACLPAHCEYAFQPKEKKTK
jgi:hypothetical protein